ncbi:hypothetical protein HG530_012007 [Fusarium avenaceum]|nr:hypothetical protein HG530_012007 [Fusarium avenaceum]
MSTTSLAEATKPDHTLMTPRATAPEMNALEEEVLITREGTCGGNEPAVEEVRSANANKERSSRASKRLALAQTGSVSAPESAEGAGSGVAPAEQENAHDANILREAVEHDPGTQEVEDDTVPARVLALAHQRTEDSDVQAVNRRISVSEPIGCCDRDKT